MSNATPAPHAMTTKTPELLPCPFCGKAPQLVKKDVEPQGDPWYGMKVEEFILCECGCSLFDGGFHDGFYDAEERAPKAWNTRADRDQLRARVSELEAENARLRLAAIADAKDHDRRVSECERWAIQTEIARQDAAAALAAAETDK